MSKKDDSPKWDPKYNKLGVSPRELYMRQNGLCWLKPEVQPDGTVAIFCTDGEEKAETKLMLNPTYECARCMVCFAEKAIKEDVEKKQNS